MVDRFHVTDIMARDWQWSRSRGVKAGRAIGEEAWQQSPGEFEQWYPDRQQQLVEELA